MLSSLAQGRRSSCAASPRLWHCDGGAVPINDHASLVGIGGDLRLDLVIGQRGRLGPIRTGFAALANRGQLLGRISEDAFFLHLGVLNTVAAEPVDKASH